ncbi:MAG: trypsin-like peptidase domain-containing protein [Planctomycetota bacterium]|nr:trypsin-like peptidase domain-containing protein [Planctomycetota bacterium]
MIRIPFMAGSLPVRLTWLCTLLTCVCVAAPAMAESKLTKTIGEVQPKIVKIYGAGGFRGLESYQSGFLISPDGHILTSYSYVLDADQVTCTLNDGRRFQAKVLGADPRTEIAVLKIEAKELPYFDLKQAAQGVEGTRTLAFSNLYGVAFGDEAASVLHGVISARSKLDARLGAYKSTYSGPVYVVDAMTNNPGAAGGALTNMRGQILGILGKELRNARNNTWLNYAVPISELTDIIEKIKSGKAVPVSASDLVGRLDRPLTLQSLGIVLVPNTLERTPPFVDAVRAGSPAAAAGLKPDDLIVFVDDRLIHSVNALKELLERTESDAQIRVTVMRGNELIEIPLEAAAPATN